MTVVLPRVLVMTHSHPRLTRGGAEISAGTLMRALKARGAATWLLGCAGAKSEIRLGASLTQPYGPDDYLYHPAAPFDYFKFANPDPKFPQVIEELVAELRPDIVHSHHFVRFGVEMFSAIRRGWPKVRIVLSLHEYLAICHHHGQMMKTVSLRRCERESYEACAACFPQYGARDFFLRKRYVQMFLDDVDLFVSPSYFLAGRFREWGLPLERIAVLENMPPDFTGSRFAASWYASDAAERSVLRMNAAQPGDTSTLRVGFFGQMSPLKGIAVLMEAAKRLDGLGIRNVMIDIHGDYSSQPLEFQTLVEQAIAAAGDNVIVHGAYDNARVNVLMQQVDVVVIPSIWWENSPVVIQEAFTNGKPVICSNIGGMAEKVSDGVDGLHFEVGNAAKLAARLAELATDPERLAALTAGVRPPPCADDVLDAHLDLYHRLLA